MHVYVFKSGGNLSCLTESDSAVHEPVGEKPIPQGYFCEDREVATALVLGLCCLICVLGVMPDHTLYN